MRNPLASPIAAIIHAELQFNSKRIAPYAMAILFSANAVLWWGWGAAVYYGWATNGDFFIGRNFGGFSFLTLPLFTAFFMSDVVIRDFRLGIDQLIFSKPVSRTTYLLGKFFGNFFVLVCCQMAFTVTLVVLQAFHPSRMVMQPVRVIPYFRVFIVSVVISHLVLAVFYFTVGSLTRNSKIVYGLAVLFYPLYFAFQLLILRGLPLQWRILLDPLLMTNRSDITAKDWANAALINQYVFSLNSDMIANRAMMILITVICLAILCFLFTRAERFERSARKPQTTTLGLSENRESVYSGEVDSPLLLNAQSEKVFPQEKTPLPKVETASEGLRPHLKQLIAALGIEFRLLRTERGLVLLAPLAVFVSTVELAFYKVNPTLSYSGTYASGTASSLLLILLGVTIFYTGEMMHRDRETRIEPILWSLPIPSHVLLLSKFLAMFLLSFSLIVLVGLIAIALQIFKGETPVEVSAYLKVYLVILIPSIVLGTGLSIALNVQLRDKYLTYALSLAIGGGLFYLYSQGYNHWLYNPVLYQLWTYTDLTGTSSIQARILVHRIYCLAICCLSLSLAHLCFQRKSEKGLLINGRLGGAGWSILIAIISVIIAVIAGLKIISSVR